MKKIIFSTMIVSLLALVGCQNEELVNETTDTGNGKKVTLTATIAGAANSRVALNEVNEYDEKYDKEVPTIQVNWEESGEEFTVYNADYSEKADFKQDSGNEFTSKDALPDGKKTAYYGRYTLSNGALSYDLSSQDGTLNEDNILMQASVTDGSSKITFEHQTAILKVKLKGVNNQAVTKIVMDDVHTGSNNESITVTPTQASLGYFYIFLPIENEGGYGVGHTFHFTVTVGSNEYTGLLTIPTGMSIVAGNLYTATIDLTPYLTFTVGGEQSLVLNVMGELDSSIKYSADGGAWTSFERNGDVDEYGMFTTIPVPFTNNLRMRGKSTSGTFTTSTGFMISFTENTQVTCSGDIRTLVDYTSYETTSTANACFKGLFMYCSALADASGLKLISNNNEMAESCYESMFANCENLTSAPERLPTMELKKSCYLSMFEDCTSLTSAPALPATTLAESCYESMFCNCENLTSAPALLAETLKESCYYTMFCYCTNLRSAPELPATTLAVDCYNQMFGNCTSLTSAPALSATTLAAKCYQNMFINCTSLESAPVLPAETLVTGCYWQMFSGCTNLNSVTMLATNIQALNCLRDWMYGVAATGTFTKAADVVIPEGESGIPSGWTVQ